MFRFLKPKYLKKEYVWIAEYNKAVKEIALLDIDIDVLEGMAKEGLGNIIVADKRLSERSSEAVSAANSN